MHTSSHSILKALAVVLLVWLTASAFDIVRDFLWIVATPALFFSVGYFFNVDNADRPAEFVERRLRGYYLPFLGWAVVLLAVHNLWFHAGLLSPRMVADGVAVHPYGWHEFSQRLWSIALNMSAYDEVMAACYWLFRTLLLSTVGFLVLFIVGRKISRFENDREIGWAIFVVAFLLALWQVLGELSVTGVAQGGYRELTGVLFISMGFLFRQYRAKIEIDWRTYLLCLCVWGGVAWFYPVHMTPGADIAAFLALPLPAFAGFVLLLALSERLAALDNRATRLLVHIGDNYLCVVAFFIVAFQLVHLLKALVYGLPVETVALAQDDKPWWHGFSLLYVAAGVGLPLAVRHLYLRLTEGRRWSFGRWGDMLFDIVLLVVSTVLRLLKAIVIGIYRFILAFFRALGEFLRASNPKDE
ncbi:MAG: hypothetical protein J6M53_07560 [Bacteroidaceae bacterium]|nr:hypothetical protein [Bacteroidaceae bacterium]